MRPPGLAIGGRVTGVRLDKFLQTSRLVRRRTVAQRLCRSGMVSQNGKISKPGTKVKEGDVLEIDLGSKVIRVRVLSDDDHSAGRMYEEITSG